MPSYTATVVWQQGAGEEFARGRYSRAHQWRFDGGAEVAASASPHHVPAQFCDPSGVDPEEAFVAALASCHLLWFLSLAAKAGYSVVDYRDEATARMERNAAGKLAITQVWLRPRVRFAGAAPSEVDFAKLHEAAHDECFLAQSVRSDVRCDAVLEVE